VTDRARAGSSRRLSVRSAV